MTPESALLLLREEHPEQEHFAEETLPENNGSSRWSQHYSQVYKNLLTGTFWEISWSRGSTEYQDEGFEDVSAREVRPVVKTVTVYE